MQKRFNKRGQDLSIGTLILIVLGIIVLVLLILGFSMGWSNLWQKINIFGGGASISDVVAACRLAYSSQDTYTFCNQKWDVKLADGTKGNIGCTSSQVTPSLGSEILTCP